MTSASARPKVFVAGHRGMVGAALVRRLAREDCRLVLRTRAELDLTDQRAVDAFFAAERPDHVYLAAARVGGILANDTKRGEFIHQNLAIQTNVIDAARRNGCVRLLFLGSSCIYPRLAPQPIPESALMSGPLEPTNSAYAVAKIAGIEMLDAYRKQYGLQGVAVMPCNLYGPGDNYDPFSSHVLAALIAKAVKAKAAGAEALEVWGSGTPRREFLHVDDCADACVHLMRVWESGEIVNIGSGADMTIAELATAICREVGFAGRLALDPTKPDGTPRKLLDVARLAATGWRPRIGFTEGLADTIARHLPADLARLAAA